MKPYRFHPISECFEPLVDLTGTEFSCVDPHPYLKAGADYRGVSPWQLRLGVYEQLKAASRSLSQSHSGWSLYLFDAYRPIAVQNDMVRLEFLRWSKGRHEADLSEKERDRIYQKVYRIWAVPSDDPATPPPHSTGAAMDLTLIDSNGEEVWMGSPIDENSDRSNPDYFKKLDPVAHEHRRVLCEAMESAGFTRHPEEWWHFSYGDQMWAWLTSRETGHAEMARYGRADLI